MTTQKHRTRTPDKPPSIPAVQGKDELEGDPLGLPHPDAAFWIGRAKDWKEFEDALPPKVRAFPILARRLSLEVCEFAKTRSGGANDERRVGKREWHSLASAAKRTHNGFLALPESYTRLNYGQQTVDSFIAMLDKVANLAHRGERGELMEAPTDGEVRGNVENAIGFLLAVYGLRLTTYPDGILAKVLTAMYRALGEKRADDPDSGRVRKRLKDMWTTETVGREIPLYLEVMGTRAENALRRNVGHRL